MAAALVVSGLVLADTASAADPAPDALVNVRASAGFDRVRVRFDTQTGTGKPASGAFRLYRGVDGATPTLLRTLDIDRAGSSWQRSDLPGYDDTDVAAGHRYTYEVAGVSDAGVEGPRVSVAGVSLVDEEFLLGGSYALWSGPAKGAGGLAEAVVSGRYSTASYAPGGRTYVAGPSIALTDGDPASIRVLGQVPYTKPDGTVEMLGSPGQAYAHSTVSHDGRWIVSEVVPADGFPSDLRMLARYPLTASGSPVAGAVIAGSEGLSEPLFTADGQVLARLATDAASPLYRLVGRRRVAVKGTEGATLAASSPDGRWIAFLVRRGELPTVARIVPAGGGTARTVAVTGAVNAVGFSPDATRLFVATGPDAQQDALVWRARADGTVLDNVAAQVVAQVITSRVRDTKAPVARVSSATVPVTLAASVKLDFVGSDTGAGGLRSFDLRRRTISASGAVSRYASPEAWQSLVTRSVAVPLTAGVATCVGVRARDGAGNLSAFTADRCTARAADDGTLTASSRWSEVTSSRLYGGSAQQTTRRGQTLTARSVAGRTVTVVVTRCPTCGTVDVRIGRTLLGSLSLRGRAADKVLLAVTAPRRVSGTLTVTVTSSGRRVQVDGFAVTP